MFATPLETATFLAFCFVATFLVFVTWLRVPHKAFGWLDARAAQIGKELDEARQLRDEAQALLEDYKKRAKNAEHEAKAIIEQAKLDAERMKEEAKKTLNDMVERRAKAAENKIAQAEAQAIADVRAAASNVAIAAAQDVLSARMGEGLGAKLIDKSIADVKSQLN
jgi:F-type H+-transporting ATPase subunit b